MNFMDMLGKFREMKKEMTLVQEKLEGMIVEAEAGGGMVRVKCTGARKVMKIEIDPDIVDKSDPELMADLITAAVNKALEKADELGKAEIAKVSGNMIPGMDLGGLDLSKLGL